MNEDKKYWVAFNCIPGIGRVRFALLEKYFGNMDKAWHASPSEFKSAGVDSAAIRSIIQWRPKISPDDEIARLERFKVTTLTCNDRQYPARLKEIYDYPPVLYVRGSLLPEDEWCLAVVGTRRATIYGKQVTEEIVTDLAQNRITIVSGLAKGIDTVAHKSALAAGGRTIAVCACGLDMVYPSENTSLARNIMECGALISEYPLGTRPRPEYFPRRNRILSGLSLGVLVTEASQSSGAIITANLALEQNREVFAIPGSILSPASAGSNHLIQEGAKLISDYSEIMEELNLTSIAHQIEIKEVLPESAEESALLKYLSSEPVHIDEVCRNSGLSAANVSSTLAMLELKGMVKQVGTMNFALARETRQEYRVKVD